jgi:pimeloyl-ACP methyl ester carboxylesterase
LPSKSRLLSRTGEYRNQGSKFPGRASSIILAAGTEPDQIAAEQPLGVFRLGDEIDHAHGISAPIGVGSTSSCARVVAPNLPSGDDSAGLRDHADTVVAAVGDRRNVIVVAQSLAGFSAPLVCTRVPVSLLVLVAAMMPASGESPREWFTNTGWAQARREYAKSEGRTPTADVDVMEDLFHDVSPEVVAEALSRPEPRQSETPFDEPWPLDRWPDVPTKFVLCRDDRFFPAEFMRRIVLERLGLTPDEMVSGHLPALSHPEELVERLEAYRMA